MAAKKQETIRLDSVYFNQAVFENSAAKMYGYVSAQVTIPGVLNGADFTLIIKDVQVKRLNGKPRIDFPVQRDGDTGDVKLDKNGKAYSVVFSGNKETRQALTALIWKHPVVRSAIDEIEASENGAQAATGTDDLFSCE